MFGIDDQATRDFLKAHDDFTYKIITPWMKLFIHFYTNRWICTIWETSKERKHCQDQEGGFSKYFLLYILIIDHFYIALLSALKKTHCAVVACDSEWVTVCSHFTSSAAFQGVEPQTYILAAIFYIMICRVWLCKRTCPHVLELMLTYF